MWAQARGNARGAQGEGQAVGRSPGDGRQGWTEHATPFIPRGNTFVFVFFCGPIRDRGPAQFHVSLGVPLDFVVIN